MARCFFFAFFTLFHLSLTFFRPEFPLNVTCESEFHILSNTKVSATRDHGQKYMKVRAPLVHHLLRNRLLLLLQSQWTVLLKEA